MNCKPYIAIIGAGKVPAGVYPERSAMENALRASVEAIKNAGIDKDDIDMVITTTVVADPERSSNELGCARLVEELGLKRCQRNFSVFSGGSSCTNALKVAHGMIAAGTAKVVLLAQGEKLATFKTGEAEGAFDDKAFSPEWEAPFGLMFDGLNGICLNSMLEMGKSCGFDRDDIMQIAVSNSKWGVMNPDSYRQKELTLEEIKSKPKLNSGIYPEEFGAYVDGGNALIVTSKEMAEKYGAKPVYMVGAGGYVDHCTMYGEQLHPTDGYAVAAKEAYESAGLTPADIDLAECYDYCTPGAITQFEQALLMQPGEFKKYFSTGATEPGGSLPYCTHGGIMSEGHVGAGSSMSFLVEVAKQLRGEAGERQVPGCRTAITCSSGGTGSDPNVTIFSNYIPE